MVMLRYSWSSPKCECWRGIVPQYHSAHSSAATQAPDVKRPIHTSQGASHRSKARGCGFWYTPSTEGARDADPTRDLQNQLRAGLAGHRHTAGRGVAAADLL